MCRLNVIPRNAQLRGPLVVDVRLLFWRLLLLSAQILSLACPPLTSATAHQNHHHRIKTAHLFHLRHPQPQVAASLISEDATIAQPTTTTTTTTPQPAVEAPEFEEPIGNHTVAVGRDAQLSCKIRNLGNFRTAWLRVEDKGILTIHNNVITRNYRFGLLNNENERNFVLTIKNVQPSDRGGYMCQINSVPMKYAVGHLDVLTPPVFDETAGVAGAASSSSSSSLNQAADGGPQEGELAAGDSVAAAATALASGQLVPGASASATTASNSSQVTVRENSSATLQCRASGHPAPSITWRREDGRPILLQGIDSSLDASPLEIKDSNALAFSSIQRVNSGAYLCIASNGVQPAASKRQLLDVQFSPIITLPRAEVPGQLGQLEARLECLVELNPLGSYHWIKLATTTTNTDRRPMVANQEDDLWLIEHDELLQSDKFDIVMKQINSEKVQMVLTLRNVERQDFSWYKCVARNSLGLQSNFIRFFESAGAATAAQATPSSSFSFNSMFRGGGSGGQPSSGEQQQQDEPQPGDEQQEPPGRQAGGKPARAHTRSSWTQRSRARAGADASAAPAATHHCRPLVAVLLALLSLVPYLLSGPLAPTAATTAAAHRHLPTAR